MGCSGSKAADGDAPVEINRFSSGKLNGYSTSVDDKGSAVTAGFVRQHNHKVTPLSSKYDVRGSKILGKGAFGVVQTCKRVGTAEVFALKTISVGMLTEYELQALQNEVDILRKLDHPGIVRLFETFFDRDEAQLHVVMENLSGGNLRQRLMERGTYYDEATAARLMRGMHSAILYCHQHAVCHRDIKLENFVFEREGDQAALKLIDFGLSTIVAKGSEKMTEQVGTVAFMAPEMLVKEPPKYNTACDMWALGVAMYELLAGFLKRPYSTGPIGNRSYANQLKAITKQGAAQPPPREPPLSAEGADLLTRLLAINPADRISPAAAMEHPWLGQAEFASPSLSPGSKRSAALRLDSASSAMAGFAELSPLQRLAFDAMAFSITPRKLEQLRRTFHELDVDGSGTLSLAELRKLLGGDATAEAAFAALDTMKTGKRLILTPT